MHEGKHGILDGVEDMDDIFGTDEEELKEHEHDDHDHEHDDHKHEDHKHDHKHGKGCNC